MPSILIVGATRGLGASLANQYAGDSANTVYATTRSASPSAESGEYNKSIKWVPGIDLLKSSVGSDLAFKFKDKGELDVVIISAGAFMTEDFSNSKEKGKGPNWDNEVTMYTTSSIAPVFIVHSLFHQGLLKSGAKVVFVSSEAGSITLRHEKEGGGNYAHHASKAALNMAAKLLSLDLKESGVVVSIVHPGFMRTEMTKNVGFDKHWDEGGAVTPDVAAESLREWVEKLDMSKSGEYWAPRGPRDIGMAETVMGENLRTPLKLPW
ncbi:oxidoreductase [Xylariaceae sp. FL1272]|nr:oxidoreductase [Xylariaceae sp. FL1272]